MTIMVSGASESAHKSAWITKRDKAIKRFVAACENPGDATDDAENSALDAVTVAHLAAAFEFEGGSHTLAALRVQAGLGWAGAGLGWKKIVA
jgi:hypothetical protein